MIPIRLFLCLPLLLAACHGTAKPGPDEVFVSDERGVVHMVDGASGRIEGKLQTGKRPRGMALSADGKTLYVAASDANRIEAWDTHLKQRTRLYDAGSDPERFALSPDGRSFYAANEDESVISKFDLGSGAMVWDAAVGPEPEGVAVSPDGKLVVSTSETSSTAHFIEAASGKVVATALVGNRPRFALFVPALGEVWVSSEQRGTITVFDAHTYAQKAVIDLVPAFPEMQEVQAVEMRLTRDGARLFVAMGRANRVAEIDPRSRKVVRSFPTGERTWGIALSPDEHRLYAASGLSGSLTIVDLVRNKELDTIKLDGRPWGVVAAAR